MKIVRFLSSKDKVCLGHQYDGDTAAVLDGDVFGPMTDTGMRAAVKKVLPPVDPPAVLCIGLNYKLHAKETGLPLPQYPVLFMKNPAAASGHKNPIVIPAVCADPDEVDYEAELAVVIKEDTKDIPVENALDAVLGYCCANDVSARRWQKHAGGGQWIRGKSYDGFCPFGPALVTPDEIKNPQDLSIQCRVNGQTMQKSRTSDMIFSVARIISYLSEATTLKAGTLILTGTPEGVGFTRKPPVYLRPGDLVAVEIEGLGILENPVA